MGSIASGTIFTNGYTSPAGVEKQAMVVSQGLFDEMVGIMAHEYGRLVGLPEGLAALAAPNPFNPSTTIYFQMPESGEVSLVVYNLAGRWSRP